MAALLVGATGCSSQVAVNGGEGGEGGVAGQGGDGGTTTSTGQGGTGGAGGGAPMGITIDCEAACATPPDGACFESADCEVICDGYNGGWQEAGADAFSFCAANDFMCFEDFQGCTLRTLYPDPVAIDASIAGEGLGAYEGMAIHARFPDDPAAPLAEGVIAQGSFALTITGSVTLHFSPTAVVWIDSNGDGSCGAEDTTGFVTVEISPPFEAPILEGELTAAQLQPGGQACNFL